MKNREHLENLSEVIPLQSQVKALRLQDKQGKENFHEVLQKIFESVTKSFKEVSEDATNTITEISIENNELLSKLNDKLLELLNDMGIIAFCLLSPLSKVTNPEHTNQYKPVKDPDSDRVSDLPKNKTIPVTLYNNLLTFRDTDKKFKLEGNL